MGEAVSRTYHAVPYPLGLSKPEFRCRNGRVRAYTSKDGSLRALPVPSPPPHLCSLTSLFSGPSTEISYRRYPLGGLNVRATL